MKKATTIIMVIALLVLIGWDIYVFIEPTPEDTISEITLWWAKKTPFIPFGLGVLGGHFTWPGGYTKIPILVVLAAAWLVVGIFLSIPPIFPFLTGVLAGHFLWGQNDNDHQEDAGGSAESG